MNVLLLGNGFDLYHKFPTKYCNFLHTVDFLIKHYNPESKTIGDIFGNSELQQSDEFITESYKKYKDIYDNTPLNDEQIKNIIKLTKDNVWFSYLLKSFNKDVGWIDFEKEISVVIQTFQDLFQNDSIYFNSKKFQSSNIARYILLENFNFCLWKPKNPVVLNASYEITPNYTIEYPLGSKHYIVDKEEIIEVLFEALLDLSEALKIYLICFIETIFEQLKNKGFEQCLAISKAIDKAITFNYTNTFESFYHNSSLHLHGNINDNIILGVNPDSYDDLSTVDTSFLSFKKYYQRVANETDSEYLQLIRELKRNNEKISLMIFGHSLDVTDKDIVMELFSIAEEIIILYYNDKSKHSLISNIVKMYGMDGFLSLRSEQNLTFLPLDMDFTEFVEKRAKKVFDEFDSVLKTMVFD